MHQNYTPPRLSWVSSVIHLNAYIHDSVYNQHRPEPGGPSHAAHQEAWIWTALCVLAAMANMHYGICIDITSRPSESDGPSPAVHQRTSHWTTLSWPTWPTCITAYRHHIMSVWLWRTRGLRSEQHCPGRHNQHTFRNSWNPHPLSLRRHTRLLYTRCRVIWTARPWTCLSQCNWSSMPMCF